jgi:Flp pilus assembly protein TadB
MSYMIALTVFFLGMTTVMALYFGLTTEEPRNSWQSARGVSPYGAAGTLDRSSLQWSGISGKLLAWWINKTEAADQNSPEVRQTHIALTRAGFNQVEQLAVYRAARIASFVLVIAAGLVLAHFHPRWRIPALLGGAVIGYLLPGNIVKRLGRKRQLTILHELPAILDLLVVTLEAGQGLLEAIKVVGRETAR